VTVFPVGSAVNTATAEIPAAEQGITVVFDATAHNIESLPFGQAAGYDTGGDGIAWTTSDFAMHPRALHIDQNPTGDVPTADVLDVENGAATPATAPAWVSTARKSIEVKARIGQRILPVIYMSASNVTPVVNALVAAGIKHNVGLWVANYDLTQAEAIDMVVNASGPFPVVGVQYTDNPPDGLFDTSVFSRDYLANMVDKTDWIHLAGIPADSSVYYNEHKGTLGYMNSAGNWIRVSL
jgi:hypothetical protein